MYDEVGGEYQASDDPQRYAGRQDYQQPTEADDGGRWMGPQQLATHADEDGWAGPLGASDLRQAGMMGEDVAVGLPVPVASSADTMLPDEPPAGPAMPMTLEDTDIDAHLLQELALKHLAATGVMTGGELAVKLRLPATGVVDELVHIMRTDSLVELMTGGNTILGVTGMRIKLTSHGEEVAQDALRRSGYIGPAPVSLAAYEAQQRTPLARPHSVPRADVLASVGHLVLPELTAERLGTGLRSGGPILLHGPSGNGKTSLALAIADMLDGGTFIPYAVEVEGNILQVLDYNLHEPAVLDGAAQVGLDRRWVYCRRPVVRAGAELQLSSFELRYNDQNHTYDCPLQFRAAGGVLLLDDLGTQQAKAADLVSRCLEPITTGRDLLTTLSGQRISVPFTSLLVLATAEDPATLFGEQVLRRLPCKIEVSNPTVEAFATLFQRACQEAGVEYSQAGVEYAIEACYVRPGRMPRASHPAALVRLVSAIASYFGIPAVLGPELIEMAAGLYFV